MRSDLKNNANFLFDPTSYLAHSFHKNLTNYTSQFPQYTRVASSQLPHDTPFLHIRGFGPYDCSRRQDPGAVLRLPEEERCMVQKNPRGNVPFQQTWHHLDPGNLHLERTKPFFAETLNRTALADLYQLLGR